METWEKREITRATPKASNAQTRTRDKGSQSRKSEIPPPPSAPRSDDDVRRLLQEALIEKIREVDASDWETMEKYLGKIKELGEPAKQGT